MTTPQTNKELVEAAKELSERLWPTSSQQLPHEVFALDKNTVAIVIDQHGIDYILTMNVVPKQRERPVTQ